MGETTELLGYHGNLDASQQRTFVSNPVRALSPVYASAELLWYLSRESSIDGIKAYAPSYARYANDGKAHGAYGARWMSIIPPYDQIFTVIKLLREKPETRQAVVQIWDGRDLIHSVAGDRNDIPCTLSWQFIVRGGALQMITTMRSQDVWLGMPYDVYVNTCIQRLIATELSLDVGVYTHNCGSLHFYEKNKLGVEKAEEQGVLVNPAPHDWKNALHDTMTYAPYAVGLEAAMRRGEVKAIGLPHHEAFKACGNMLQDALLCVSQQWGYGSHQLQSPCLFKALSLWETKHADS